MYVNSFHHIVYYAYSETNMKTFTGNEYFESLKPVLYILKISGQLPLALNNRDTWLGCCISRITFLMSLGVYGTSFVINLMVIRENMVTLVDNFNFVYFVRMTTFLGLRIYVLWVPFIMWNKSKCLNEYWNRWKLLQDDFEIISGTQYKFTGKRKILFLASIVLFLSALAAISFLLADSWTITIQLISNVMTITLANGTLAYWYGNCIYIKYTTRKLLKLIQKTMDNETDYRKLQKLVFLWTDLCELVHMFNTIHSILFLSQIVIALTSSISNLYSAIVYYISRDDKTAFVVDLIGAMFGFGITFLYCETAHGVFQLMTPRLETMLLSRDTSMMGKPFLTTMCSFLNTIETRDLRINLNGFMQLDRSTFPTILAAGMNYLIILRQFGITYEK